jgi:hypothetical protein
MTPRTLAAFALLALLGIGGWAMSASAQPPRIYAPDGTYLGNLSANRFDPDSVNNPFGEYGSRFSPNSVRNPFAQ